MKEMQVIDKREIFGVSFNIYGTWEEPLFLAKDIANMIEHSDVSKMVRNVDANEKGTNNVRTLGGRQEMLFLTEYGSTKC